MEFQLKKRYDFDDLLALMAFLRSENGCPWDRAQTHASVRSNFLEETYEAVEALDENDPVHLCEELGDVLLQVVFHARMEEETGRFGMLDVVDGLCRKLVERHPHVFGQRGATTPEQALQSWDEVKKRARGQQTQADALGSVSHALPAAMRSAKVWRKATKNEPVPPKTADLLAEAHKRLDKLAQVLAQSSTEQTARLSIAHATGFALFSLCAFASSVGVEAEQALTDACDAYIRTYTVEENRVLGAASPSQAALAALREQEPVLQARPDGFQ
ncbi:MAG: MazG family protein [Ethanoligenens sp.]